MNTQILNKCIEELKSDKPDLSYIRGILETLVDSTVPVTASSQWQPQSPQPYVMTTTSESTLELTDEEKQSIQFARSYAIGPVAELG